MGPPDETHKRQKNSAQSGKVKGTKKRNSEIARWSPGEAGARASKGASLTVGKGGEPGAEGGQVARPDEAVGGRARALDEVTRGDRLELIVAIVGSKQKQGPGLVGEFVEGWWLVLTGGDEGVSFCGAEQRQPACRLFANCVARC